MTPIPAPSRIPAPGFSDPVSEAQLTFRAILDALARPTRPIALTTAVAGTDSLTPAAAAVLLTLCDDATAIWLDDRLRSEVGAVEAWLAFHTGAPVVASPGKASFAVVSSPAALPQLSIFAEGTDEAPHTSATIIVLDPDLPRGKQFTADGPGFERPVSWSAPTFPADFATQWEANRAKFPRGVDLIIAAADTIVGLPRTTRLAERSVEVA